ncbi:GntR family transcriptional regulator [Bacillaceae bacterium S4-13-58]
MIDKNSPLPIYYQLEEEIRNLIHSGQLAPGEKLPSEKEYVERYSISRMTVRQAITNLVLEGLIVRQKGKGTFVAEKKYEQTLKGITSFSEDMRARGLEPSTTLISFGEESADTFVANKLNIGPGDSVFKIYRLRLANQSPLAIETVYTPRKIVGDMTKKDFTASFYDYIERELPYKIEYGEQEIEAAIANETELKYLKLSAGSPVLLIQRLTYLSNKAPFEYVRTVYRGDKYKFTINMKR